MKTNHTGDELIHMWVRGGDKMTCFNPRNAKFATLPGFWTTQPVEQGEVAVNLQPEMAIGDQTCKKFFGIGIDKEGLNGQPKGSRYLIFYEQSTMEICHVPEAEFKKNFTKITAIEQSLDNSAIFIAGELNSKGVLGAVTFDSDIQVIKFINVEPSVTTVTHMRRFIGRDWLLLGSANIVHVYAYSNKDFRNIKNISVPGCNNIIEIRAKYNKILVLDQSGQLFLKRAGMRLDMTGARDRGRS